MIFYCCIFASILSLAFPLWSDWGCKRHAPPKNFSFVASLCVNKNIQPNFTCIVSFYNDMNQIRDVETFIGHRRSKIVVYYLRSVFCSFTETTITGRVATIFPPQTNQDRDCWLNFVQTCRLRRIWPAFGLCANFLLFRIKNIQDKNTGDNISYTLEENLLSSSLYIQSKNRKKNPLFKRCRGRSLPGISARIALASLSKQNVPSL